MINALISDFSKVLLFKKDDKNSGKLNELHQELLKTGDYDFWNYFTLNTELLDYYVNLSSKIEIYIFTSEYIQEYPPVMEKISPLFKDIFSALRLGVSKSTPEAYTKIASLIQKSPDEIVFVDDTEINIKAAQAAGLVTVHYQDNETAIEELNKIINK